MCVCVCVCVCACVCVCEGGVLRVREGRKEGGLVGGKNEMK